MQAMMAQRAWRMQVNGGKKPAAKAKEAPPVVVSCNLKAQIRLSAPNPDEMLVLTHGLEERIKAADLGGVKALKQGAPQDEELAQEEMQGMMNGGDEQRVRSGFHYLRQQGPDRRSGPGSFAKRSNAPSARLPKLPPPRGSCLVPCISSMNCRFMGTMPTFRMAWNTTMRHKWPAWEWARSRTTRTAMKQ